MGIWSWFFPSEADRIRKARAYQANGMWASARDELMGLEGQEATNLLVEVEVSLASANLDQADDWARGGDDFRVESHLELAERFHHGRLTERLVATRRTLRALRAEYRREEEQKAIDRDRQVGEYAPPESFRRSAHALDGLLPTGLSPELADELGARLALVIENYPSAWRPDIGDLGPVFAQALIEAEEGRPEDAYPLLLGLPDRAPAVWWERSRAALSLGFPAEAATALREMARRAGGHQRVGATHSGVVLAQLEAQLGDTPAALRVLRAVQAEGAEEGDYMLAQLLEGTGELAEADRILSRLAMKYPKQREIHKVLARIRLKGGERRAAILALEAANAETCDTPGKCGYTPPDPEVLLMLATLYLEEGVPQRGLEVAETALAMLRENDAWEITYLQALVARAEGTAEASALAAALSQKTPLVGDQRKKLAQYLGVAS